MIEFVLNTGGTKSEQPYFSRMVGLTLVTYDDDSSFHVEKSIKISGLML